MNILHIPMRLLSILLAALLLVPLTAQAERKMYARMDKDSTTLTFYYDEHKQAGDYAPNTGSGDLAEWVKGIRRRQQIKAVIFDGSFKDARPTTCNHWFDECVNLESIQGIENLNTSQATSFLHMFYRCRKLASLDLTHFNTQNVTSMRSMFEGCTIIDSLDFSSFNTSKVTTLDQMFRDCESLSSLDLSSFHTENVTTMCEIFTGCRRLRSVNLSTFNTSKVPTMNGMFASCTSLESLDLSSFDTGNVTDMTNMFYKCPSLKSICLPHFDTSSVTKMYGMFQDCAALKSLDLSSFDTRKVENMRYMFGGCQALEALDLSNFDTPNLRLTLEMFQGCTNLRSIDLTGFRTEKVENMKYMFQNCKNLRTIYASSAFTTDSVISNEDVKMFDGCTSLPNYDPAHTGKERAHIGDGGYFSVAPAWVQFDEGTGTLTFQCNSSKAKAAHGYALDEGRTPGWNSHSDGIRRVVFSRSFRDARPYSCLMWFYRCSSLTRIDGLENLNTSEATSMEAMFYGCQCLTSLDLSHFDTGNVTRMDMMFKGCLGLTKINLKGFRTGKVTSMQEMFNGCSGLKALDLSDFRTDQVSTMYGMFQGCTSLATLDIPQFSTPQVKHLDKMFAYCSSLKSLDLSGMSTERMPTTNQMFDYCSSLQTIYVGDSFLTKEGTNMFRGCGSLRGAVPFDETRTGTDMANYVTGYLTRKVGTHGSKPIGAVGNPLTIDSLTLRDGQAFSLQMENCHAATASYYRPMSSMWGTLCLPFSICPADKDNTCHFYALLEMGEESITLQRIEDGEIGAGTPIIVRKKDKAQAGITIVATDASTVTAPQNATEGDRLAGTFDTVILTDDCYFIARDKFRQVSDYQGEGAGVKVNAFRAYIQPDGQGTTRHAPLLDITDGSDASSISSTKATARLNGTNAEYYDLEGRRTNSPQRGICIVKAGGKTRKIIIR